MALGPGLLESVYEALLCHELRKLGLHVQTQVILPIVYDGQTLENGFRIDMLVEHKVVIELKSVEVLLEVHHMQLAYLPKAVRPQVGPPHQLQCTPH